MQRRSLIRAVSAVVAALAARFSGVHPPAASAAPPENGMMGGMMGGRGMDEMMKPDNMMGPMRTGMELFWRHAEIKRTVTDLPNGVHAVTESADPQTDALIQAHVSEMYERLDQDRIRDQGEQAAEIARAVKEIGVLGRGMARIGEPFLKQRRGR